jgi:hypothetical protein
MTVILSIPGGSADSYEIQPWTAFPLKPWESVREDIYIALPEGAFGKYSVKTLKVRAETAGKNKAAVDVEAGIRKPVRRKQ